MPKYAVLAAAATASVGVPWLLMHYTGSAGSARCDSGAGDGAALKALALLAQRNAEALREISREYEAVDASVVAAIESALDAPSDLSVQRSQPARAQQRAESLPTCAPAIWLRFAIVSVARKGDADYLLRALHSIFEQLPALRAHPARASTDVVVVNNNEVAAAHRVFHAAAAQYAGLAQFISKAEINPPLNCPAKRSFARGGKQPPKASVQRQTCDLVAAFTALSAVQPAPAHVMLLEDDWLLCPHGLVAAAHAIDKAYLYDPHWLALRVSYGFNGVVVRPLGRSSHYPIWQSSRWRLGPMTSPLMPLTRSLGVLASQPIGA